MEGWGQIVHTLQFDTADGKQYMNAEPFKLWLAQVGSERIEEINYPEIAIKRARDYYKQKGYNLSV